MLVSLGMEIAVNMCKFGNKLKKLIAKFGKALKKCIL